MRYLPHTSRDIAEMLETIKAESLDDLFLSIPESHRRSRPMDFSGPLSEWELFHLMNELSSRMAGSPESKVFIGAGSYEHYIPATVSYLLSRSEFLTPYTPYQAEVSQGTLQAIYEYQTLVARLLGMEVANASLYDGASALAEGLLMAIRLTRRNTVALSGLVHPLYRRVVETYLEHSGCRVMELPYLENGRTDLSSLSDIDDLAAVAVQSPNFFGCIEDLSVIGEKVQETGALFITCFTEPLAYGLFESPGCKGADIVCGEGQSFGIPQSFGGPGLGMFATKMKYARSMPGRLVGQTVDRDEMRAFVLTLATREQHIRREKATSNICTNSNLCALAAVMYMASLGESGIRELARLNYDKSEYLKSEFRKAGLKIEFESPTFNEFVVRFPQGFSATYERLLEKNIVAGISLESDYPELGTCYLLCMTEVKSKEDIDSLAREIIS